MPDDDVLVVDVVDNSDGLCDGGAKLVVTVVTDAFVRVPSLLKRHRMINDILKEDGFMEKYIHALSLNTWTVAQYESKK